ncbi:ABC transporter ATP-binding protein/permease [Lactonifactor longoviformis]|uniref:ATP-binding cassette, subfamily B n=1 Tax=Lactonifactor longoviformis DSM 17459 TaxID=1122155 RepID=A0A1M4SIF0_9CLOT|nr:ABC transporter ATP-binding protein [Lactonifactor longoviformis]MCB5712015.1 ABC transporter ATP-binding protein/permease [Lactonifactor longoviformis]MCB5716059.1 ABC transporter ATP-binding protein/permease [Lactonifactor longoviformis]MCQ4670914.1 ABC transporter ATP-binding protein/permease [Lactonifactor longoviformis]POP34880.1 ABC transporter ATP-binding protein [Lactonifactor longoviformis]SHE31928.1 ATP-binding cassette, subfamily B [Lactonifactor longoviformis DSM 17459]
MSNPRRGPMGGHGKMVPGEKAKDFKGTMKKLMNYMKRYKIRIFIMLVFAVGGTIFNIVGPKILGKATTELMNGLMGKINGTGAIDFSKIGTILATVLCLYAVSSVFSFVQGYVMSGISNDVTYCLRKEISQKINRIPMKYFESRTHGEILSRVTNDVDTLQMSLNQSITQLITSVTTLLGALIMMLSINIWMTCAALLILPVSMMIIGKVMKHSQKYFQAQQRYLGEVNGQVEEIYSGQNVVKVFNKEDAVVDEFEKTNDKLYDSAWKSQFFSGMMMPIMQFVGNLGYVMVALLGGFLTIKGSIEVGDVQAFFQYIRNFTQPVQQIAQVTNMLQSSAAASERVFEFLEEEEEDQTVDQPADIADVEGNVEFDHVSFGYHPEQIIIHDFSADIKSGQKVAIVGPTGAGKTTMVKLLMRFYDVNTGEIKVDGHNIKDFNRSELRELFGMVLQDTWLFNGTILENIRYGRLDATDEEVIEAAKAAHAHRFIMAQPDGYQTILDEETSNISQGQKQLLTIARTILADNKILILDEATSSVDTRTEVRIQKAMDNLMRGRTSFIIAHRLSTIRDADLILVMRDGDIIEQGTHEELLAKGGFYENLYNSQFEKAEAV